MSEENKSYKQQHAENLISSLKGLKTNESLVDFKIGVGSSVFLVHRAVLAACSEYFRAMLSHNMKENKDGFVNMKDVDEEAVRVCVEFMYTGEAEVEMSTLVNILHVSSLMQLGILNEICFAHARKHLSIETVILVKSLAQIYSCAELLLIAEDFFTTNFENIIDTEAYALLPFDEVKNYVSTLEVSHELIWKSIRTWFKNDKTRLRSHFFEIFSAFCAREMSSEFMINFFWKDKKVRKSAQCKTYLINKLLSDVVALKNDVNSENCFTVLKFVAECDHENAAFMKDEVRFFIAQNFEKLTLTNEWKALEMMDAMVLLRDLGTDLSTEDVRWTAALRWVKHDPLRAKQFPDFFNVVDFWLLSDDFIKTSVLTESLVKESSNLVNMLTEIMWMRREENRDRGGDGSLVNEQLNNLSLENVTPEDTGKNVDNHGETRQAQNDEYDQEYMQLNSNSDIENAQSFCRIFLHVDIQDVPPGFVERDLLIPRTSAAKKR